jgi:putative ABC transport system permease protein
VKITEGLRESFDVISGNKIRSFLTILGINFGVGCLIAIAVIGMAFRDTVGSEVGKYGSTMLWVQVDNQAYMSREKRVLLDERDITFFKQSLPGRTGSGSIFDRASTVSYKGETTQVTVYGAEPDHFDMFDINITKGRMYYQQDVENRRRVCVLRPDIASRLFKFEDPIGKQIRISEKNYTVIGITDRLSNNFLSDGSDNNTVFVPSDFIASKIWGGGGIKYWVYLLKFENLDYVDIAEERMETYLNNKYGLLRGEQRFRIQRLDSYVGMVDNILDIITTLVLVIASISIVVGGLGIMNIMLVAVTERTKEIGLRMAVGATRSDIIIQFVIEAIVLCIIGGGTGVIFGAGTAAIACIILKWKFMLTLVIVLGAIGVSTVIGLIFGIYPAWKASRMMPVEALRSDY